MLKALLALEDDTKASLLLVLFVALMSMRYWDSHSADLMASWVAGHFLHNGRADAVYTGVTHAFTLAPHPEWVPFLETTDYSGPVYPFIYPPLWAWLMGHLPRLQDFWVFMVFMTAVNATLLAATVQLAFKAARTSVPRSVWVLTAALVLSMTSIGTIPMMQNQPHILVSFLLVLAIERSRAGAQTTAGMALALAASLKLLPALFALAFLVLGQRRAFGSFAVSGALLGGASVAVAGWPLHQAFLAELKGISDTILVTGMSFNVHSSIAQLFFSEHLQVAETALAGIETTEKAEFHFVEAGAAAVLLARLALIVSVGWCLWLLRVSDDDTRYAVVWPLMITLTAVTSPLSWAYYFIPAVAFLPVLYERFGRGEGCLAICLIVGPLTDPAVRAYLNVELFAENYQLVGTFAIVGLTVAFVLAVWRRPVLATAWSGMPEMKAPGHPGNPEPAAALAAE